LAVTNGAPMQFNLIDHSDVKKVDLPKIDSKNAAMIRRVIEERLTVRPEVFGRPLRGTLGGYWKLRVGDYRIVFKLSGTDILILAIIDRKTVC
jgi:mRNA interferase RelE/StbE